MNNKIALTTIPMAARMQKAKAKWKEENLTISSCVPYTITPIRIKTPAIKQYIFYHVLLSGLILFRRGVLDTTL